MSPTSNAALTRQPLKRGWLWCCLLVLLVTAGGCSRMSSSIVPAQPVAWGYVAWWVPQAWMSVPLQRFERLLFFEIRISPEGDVRDANGWPQNFPELREVARIQRIPLDLTLTLHDLEDFNQLFGAPQSVARFVQTVERLASGSGVQGIQLDVEIYQRADPRAVAAFRATTELLSGRLASLSPPRALSVFLPIGGDEQIYDAASLRGVSYAVLQGYDAHWQAGETAGPVAPLIGPWRMTWEKAVAEARRLGLDAPRILMGYPLYGYEWPVHARGLYAPSSGRGDTVTLAGQPTGAGPNRVDSVLHKVARHGCGRDPYTASSFYEYQRNDSSWVTGWFDGPADLDRKHRFLADQKIRGAAFFALGYDGYALTERYFARSQAMAEGRQAGIELAAQCNSCGVGCGG